MDITEKKIILVDNVQLFVSLVEPMQMTVLNVLTQELTHQPVNAQAILMNLIMVVVLNVMKNVQNVKATTGTVLNVHPTELKDLTQNVHAQMDNTNLVMIVTIVNSDVPLVTELLVLVPSVLMKQDLDLLIVNVSMGTMKRT